MPTTEAESTAVTSTTRQLRDNPVDVKVVLSALWVAMLLGSLVEAALLGVIARTAWTWPADHVRAEPLRNRQR